MTDAADLWNTCCDLRALCTQLHDPKTRLDRINISLMQPFKPMLAQRADDGIDKA